MARLVEAKKRREGLEAKKKEDEEQAVRQAESLNKAMKKANLIAAAEQVRPNGRCGQREGGNGGGSDHRGQ